jgi:OHCU decarboxylase
MREFSEQLNLEPKRLQARLRRLNSLPFGDAHEAFMSCCGSPKWADAMVRARPFPDLNEIACKAEENFDGLAVDDWKEAFAAHPRIGETRVRGGEHAQRWSQQEQAAAAISSSEVQGKLQQQNEEYYSRFGYIFIICATGKSAEQVLALLKERLQNDPAAELKIAAGEQRKITLLRLQKMMAI